MIGDGQPTAEVGHGPNACPAFPWPARKIRLDRLAFFAGNLATCVASGVDLPRALRASTRAIFGGSLKELIEDVAQRVQAGSELSEALQPAAPHFPAFFLPVLQCGERTGRLEETLRYLEHHCRMLAVPARKLRDLWMYPLAILVLGWVVELLTHLVSGSPASTLAFLVRTGAVYGGAAVLGLSFYRSPPGRLLVDRGKLLIPLLGPVERELGINRFFHVFNLLYCTGGIRVEQMLRVATRAVTNVALKQDLLRAVPVIERGGTIARALAQPEAIAQDYKALVLVGEESGTLEEAFGRVAILTAEAVDTRLNIVRQLLQRLFMPVMVFSIAMTAGSLFYSLFSGM